MAGNFIEMTINGVLYDATAVDPGCSVWMVRRFNPESKEFSVEREISAPSGAEAIHKAIKEKSWA